VTTHDEPSISWEEAAKRCISIYTDGRPEQYAIGDLGRLVRADLEAGGEKRDACVRLLAPLMETALAPHVEPLRRAAEAWSAQLGPWFDAMARLSAQLAAKLERLQQTLQAVAAALQANVIAPAAVHYCRPYDEALEGAGMPPLDPATRERLLLAACHLEDPLEFLQGRRVPLLTLAVATNDLDLATRAAVLAGVPQRIVPRLGDLTGDQREEAVGRCIVALSEQVLPDLRRRLERHYSTNVAADRRLLMEITKEAYLVTALGHEVRDELARERLRPQKEVAAGAEFRRELQLAQAPTDHSAARIREALRAYAERDGATQLDREMVAAILADPGQCLSGSALARAVGRPERTVRRRREMLITYTRSYLQG